MDTIFALASAQGRAGVAVVRISGSQAFDVAIGLVGALPAPRRTSVRQVRNSAGEVLDEALVLAFAGPASFTGEDVVELHLHGSIAVVQAVLKELSLGTARVADPGEFTRRALENDKLDLLQVEALGDLISAETEAQRKQAMRMLSGDVSQKIEGWRAQLIRAAALIEATIDFADEDVPVDVSEEVQELLGSVQSDMESNVQGYPTAERVRVGFEVAIVGRPNTGKSTLLNNIARREAAITSAQAGTTRDIIEVRMDLNGLPVTILDTAGLRVGADDVEAKGIARAMERAAAADLRIFMAEPGEDLGIPQSAQDIVIAPMADTRSDNLRSVSGKTGEGVQSLVNEVAAVLSNRVQSAGLITHERHRRAFELSVQNLTDASRSVGNGPDYYDIAAEEVRVAIRELEAVIGRVDVENLLDEIFSSFCLGK